MTGLAIKISLLPSPSCARRACESQGSSGPSGPDFVARVVRRGEMRRVSAADCRGSRAAVEVIGPKRAVQRKALRRLCKAWLSIEDCVVALAQKVASRSRLSVGFFVCGEEPSSRLAVATRRLAKNPQRVRYRSDPHTYRVCGFLSGRPAPVRRRRRRVWRSQGPGGSSLPDRPMRSHSVADPVRDRAGASP